MNEEIKKLAEQAGLPTHIGWCYGKNIEHFYRLVGERCADLCGSQGDQKNIRRHFGLDYYDGPSHYQSKRHQETQYDWSKHYVEEKK